MRNKKKNRIILLLIILLGISIGFASLATTLKINGTVNITKNEWKIYFANVGNAAGVDATLPEPTDDSTEGEDTVLTWNVSFEKPGDFYEFQVDAVNAGTIDAKIIDIVAKYGDEDIPAVEDPNDRVVPPYLNFSVTDMTKNAAPAVGDVLAKRTDDTHFTTKRYKIRVEYDADEVTIDDINKQTDDETHTFTFMLQYGQSTN